VTGLKALGVRELTYKLCFMACSTSVRRSHTVFAGFYSPHAGRKTRRHSPSGQNVSSSRECVLC